MEEDDAGAEDKEGGGGVLLGGQNICWKRHLNSHTDSSRRICHLGVDVHSFSKIMQQTVSSIAKALWVNINHQRCLLDL